MDDRRPGAEPGTSSTPPGPGGAAGDAAPAPAIAVLLATYQGADDGLAAQLDSLAAQTLPPARILVSDDGSTDATPAIVDAFAAAHPALGVERLDGPRQGAARNFLSLIRRTPDDVDMVAFCDQDDLWLPGKLDRAHARLAAAGDPADPAGRPMLYCGATWQCDGDLGRRRISPLPRRPAAFRNALVQNIASGNTIVLNRAALELARTAARGLQDTVVHDWWLYQLVTGSGGDVIFDPQPQILYRQHGRNLIGANRGLVARLWRLRHLWTGRFREWNDINIAALEHAGSALTPGNRALLDRFARGRRRGVAERLAMIRACGLYRQGRLGQLSLYAAALLGRL